jgi:hypothetical protein
MANKNLHRQHLRSSQRATCGFCQKMAWAKAIKIQNDGLNNKRSPNAWSRKIMAEFVTVPTSDGEMADVNLDTITHMRPNPANKAQIIIHFVGGHTLLVPSDRRKTLASSHKRDASLQPI